MAASKKRAPTSKTGRTVAATATSAARPALGVEVRDALAWLRRHASAKIRHDMSARYGIRAEKAFGVSMSNMQKLAKSLGRSHALAGALWKTRWYEARMLASLVDEPERVTPAQMDRWVRDFDNWAICDTACFFLFDRSPHALARVDAWAGRGEEFVRRGAFALLACVALHRRELPDDPFLDRLVLLERGADDDRNFVKKGVSWALRSIGTRGPKLRRAAADLADRLARSPTASARWIGRDALRALTRRRA